MGIDWTADEAAHWAGEVDLKVTKRDNFDVAFFTLSNPISVGDLWTDP